MKIKITSTVMFILLIIALLILTPFAAIWSVNTLFHLGIPYTFWSWLAVVVLTVFAKAGLAKS